MSNENWPSYSFPDHPETWERKGIRSLGRFITELELIDETGQHIRWNARRHRKGLGPLTDETAAEIESLTQHLNRPIALRFILGASLFFIAFSSSACALRFNYAVCPPHFRMCARACMRA